MPDLPRGFTFTQTALRTYRECPYRFRLRYLDQVPWPAFPAEPVVETALEQGRRFHELARQHFLGLDLHEQLGGVDEQVARWWAILESNPLDLTLYPRHYPEAGLSIPVGDYRLAARYDLLAVGDAAALVVDWKTGRALPASEILARDIQTRVYLYVLAQGGAVYRAGQPFPPQALAILYWHPGGPQQVHLSYDHEQHEADRSFLEGLIDEIAARPAEAMGRVGDETACEPCAYGPLCGRPGGAPDEWEPEEDLSPAEAETWS